MPPREKITPNFFKIFRFLWEFFTEKPVPTPPGIDEWINRRFGAARTQNRDAYLETIHPDCRLAVTAGGPLGDIVEKEFNAKPLEHWTVKVRIVQDREPLLLEDLVRYPVRPTHLVEANQKTPNGSKSQVWYMAQKDGAWYAVLPLPKEELAPQLAAQHAEKEASSDRIQKLYYSADPGKLTKIRELLRANRKVEAISKAQVLFQLDTTAAKQLVDHIQASS